MKIAPLQGNIYVDEIMTTTPSRKWPFKTSCHLTYMGPDIQELHRFARQIGLNRQWFQDNSQPEQRHYDLTANLRTKAIALGAVAVTWREWAALAEQARKARQGTPAPARHIGQQSLWEDEHVQEI